MLPPACALVLAGGWLGLLSGSGEPFLLSPTGSTRATGYELSNKIITRDGKLHVAWLEADSDTVIRTRDLAGGTWSAAVRLGPGADNHAGPALTIDREGYLHVVFGAHHHPFWYRRTLRPNDSSAWTEPEPVGERLTYPSLVCGPDGTLHLTARGGPEPPCLVYHRKPPGEPWSARVTLVEPRIPPGYTQYGNNLAVDSRGRLHLAFHVYDQHQRPAGKVAGYLRSDDGGASWCRADGTPVAIPASRDEIEVLERGDELDCRVGGIACDGAGNPYFVVHHVSSPSQPTLWFHDGTRWRSRDLGAVVRRVRPGAFGAANACVSVTTDDTLVIAVPVADQPGAWGHASESIVVLTSRDRGETFAAEAIDQPDADRPAWLPSLERNTGWNPVAWPHLLFTSGGPGTSLTEPLPTNVYLVEPSRTP